MIDLCLNRLRVLLVLDDAGVFSLKALLDLANHPLGVALVFRQSDIDLAEVILEVVVGRLEVHDEVLLLVDVELDVFNLLAVLFHHFLKVVEGVLCQECELLDFGKVSVILLVQILLFLEGQGDFIDLPLHVASDVLRGVI